MSVSFRMEMVEDSSVFFRKVIPCLLQMNLKLLAFLNFRHSLKRSLINLVRLSLMKILSVWSRSLLRLLKIRSLTLLEQKRAMMVGQGLSLLHLLNRWETLMSSFLMLTLSFLAVATASSSVFSC